MALAQLSNKNGIIITPFSGYPLIPTLGSNTVNAVGESAAMIGRVYLSTGSGTSKTISSSGGKIWFLTGASITFASATTNIRVGLQDINSGTGVEDGTFDVYDDLLQGTDTLAASLPKEVTMSSGSKTITHGDLIAVVIEMTARAGTDSITIPSITSQSNFPYTSFDVGGGPVKAPNSVIHTAIQFDDGTVGHFGEFSLPLIETNQAFHSGSTPDEYAMLFTLPFKCAINGLFMRLGNVGTTDTATAHLIGSPLGTPTDVVSVTLNPIIQGSGVSTAGGNTTIDITETELAAGTQYAVSYRPTDTNLRNVKLMTIPHANFRAGLPMLVSGATRSDLGAFTESLTIIPDMGIRVSKLDDGAGGGGGASARSVAYIG